MVITDGGRKAAGFKGETGDCVCRAIAIATEQPYKVVYNALNAEAKYVRLMGPKSAKAAAKGSDARTGVNRRVYEMYLMALGWEWTPCMSIGSGCKVHLTAQELPPGRIIVRLSRHLAAVIDGVLHDTHDCSRGGSRCVYGYFYKSVE